MLILTALKWAGLGWELKTIGTTKISLSSMFNYSFIQEYVLLEKYFEYETTFSGALIHKRYFLCFLLKSLYPSLNKCEYQSPSKGFNTPGAFACEYIFFNCSHCHKYFYTESEYQAQKGAIILFWNSTTLVCIS